MDYSVEIPPESLTNTSTHIVAFKDVPGWLTPSPYLITSNSLVSIPLVAQYRPGSASQNYDAWAAARIPSVPQRNRLADPDQDGLNNLEEYALALNPQAADGLARKCRWGLTTVSNEIYLTYTYRRPQPPPADLTYWVTGSLQVNPWVTGGLLLTPLNAPVDHGDHVEITLRSLKPLRTQSAGFIQMQILGSE